MSARNGDYILALKPNRQSWFAEAEGQFARIKPQRQAEETDNTHGCHQGHKAEVIGAHHPLTRNHAAFVRISRRIKRCNLSNDYLINALAHMR